MAESYAKHLDRLEHSRHAKRERRQAQITRTCRRHHLQREHRDAHVHHAGEDRASVATGGATGKQGIAAFLMYYRWPWLASVHWFALAIREYVP